MLTVIFFFFFAPCIFVFVFCKPTWIPSGRKAGSKHCQAEKSMSLKEPCSAILRWPTPKEAPPHCAWGFRSGERAEGCSLRLGKEVTTAKVGCALWKERGVLFLDCQWDPRTGTAPGIDSEPEDAAVAVPGSHFPPSLSFPERGPGVRITRYCTTSFLQGGEFVRCGEAEEMRRAGKKVKPSGRFRSPPSPDSHNPLNPG